MAKKKQSNADKKKQAPSSSKSKNFLVVGIGASAGGLDSFKQFFEKMPSDTGMAFVIVNILTLHTKVC